MSWEDTPFLLCVLVFNQRLLLKDYVVFVCLFEIRLGQMLNLLLKCYTQFSKEHFICDLLNICKQSASSDWSKLLKKKKKHKVLWFFCLFLFFLFNEMFSSVVFWYLQLVAILNSIFYWTLTRWWFVFLQFIVVEINLLWMFHLSSLLFIYLLLCYYF